MPRLTVDELMAQWQRQPPSRRITRSRRLSPQESVRQDEAFRYELLAAALERRRRAMDGMRQIVARFEPLAMAMILRHRVATARTDVIGYFDLPGTPVGRYFVFASLPLDDGGTARWFVPIDVHRGAQKLTLSSANTAWPFTVVIPAD
jgi:hypothetical protein